MGCDIHCVLEYKPDDTRPWVGLHAFEGIHPAALSMLGLADKPAHNQYSWWRVCNRHYALFADLAGVRGEGPEARGVPEDMSDLARLHIDRWAGDGHSHSWGLLSEIGIVFLAHCKPENVLEEDRVQHIANLFNININEEIEIDDLARYRLVYFFDN